MLSIIVNLAIQVERCLLWTLPIYYFLNTSDSTHRIINSSGRDRFILSAGHESMLYYAILYLIGWLSIDDLKEFRKLHSLTPGHPEYNITPGIECTTGPLGQGAAMSVGMAIAASHLKGSLSKLFNHRIWCLLGDGCIQEEITHGAGSLAGHLGLSNLIWYYDCNKAQISGNIHRVCSNNYYDLFTSMGWNVIEVTDGHNHHLLRKAITDAIVCENKPSIIIGHTVIAKGAYSLEGSYKTHGSPFEALELQLTKKKLQIENDTSFSFPGYLIDHFRQKIDKNLTYCNHWLAKLTQQQHNNNFYKKYQQYFDPDLQPQTKDFDLNALLSTRAAFGKTLGDFANQLPNLIGGSADLEPSNYTHHFANIVKDFSKDYPQGRNIAFGVREFTMAAVSNGIALHRGLIPFNATFLVFSDYMRPAIRLAAIQKIKVIFQFTHDSFYVGEDGPTHQPIEHIMSLRLIPNLYVFRPSDGYETQILMKKALTIDAPSCFILTRQNVPFLYTVMSEYQKDKTDRNMQANQFYNLCHLGGWIVKDFIKNQNKTQYVIYTSGSEVSLSIKCAYFLEKKSKNCSFKVVALTSWELFSDNSAEYQNKVLSRSCKRKISIEAGQTLGWEKYIGDDGLAIGVGRFGESASAKDLENYFGFNCQDVAKKVIKHFAIAVD